MAEQKNCKFCNETVKYSLSDGTTCKTCIYDNDFCFAFLSDEPCTVGHTLVVLKKHKADIKHKIDITDHLSEADLSHFIHAIHKVAAQLKNFAKNEHGRYPDRIYVCMLGDGIEHLHAHLIPRYPFTEYDKTTYRGIFMPRDGVFKVSDAIKKCKIGGFWYVAEREKNCDFAKKSKKERTSFLEKLADDLRLTQ